MKKSAGDDFKVLGECKADNADLEFNLVDSSGRMRSTFKTPVCVPKPKTVDQVMSEINNVFCTIYTNFGEMSAKCNGKPRVMIEYINNVILPEREHIERLRESLFTAREVQKFLNRKSDVAVKKNS